MKIYFTASMSGKNKYQDNYEVIVSTLKDLGHKVFEETVKPSKEYVYEEISDDEKIAYYRKVLRWMNDADLIVVEASYSSLSIGHELTIALEKGKPVIVLYTEGQAPHFLIGVKSDKLLVEKYRFENLKQTLTVLIEKAAENIDTRFNFFISPQMADYMDGVAKRKRVSRAVYIRKLVEREMKKERFEE